MELFNSISYDRAVEINLLSGLISGPVKQLSISMLATSLNLISYLTIKISPTVNEKNIRVK